MNRYVIFSNASGYGGAEKSLELIVKQLALNNAKTAITIFAENDRHIEALKNIDGVNVIRLLKGNGMATTLFNLWKVFRTIKRIQSSYILTNTNKGAMYLSLISRIYSVQQDRVIVYIRDFQWKYAKFILNNLSKVNIAVPSRAVLDNLNYKMLLRNYKIFETGNIVEQNLLVEADDDIHDQYILCLANISRWKGIIYLLESYKKSKVWEKGIKLQIAGKIMDQEYFQNLTDYVKKNKLSSFVIFKNFATNTKSLYKSCLFVVNSSISDYGGPETFGRTIIEAWSFHKAPISLNVGGPKYIIKNGYNGILVEEKDVDSYSVAIQKLAYNKTVRNQLAENGYMESRTKYSDEAVVKRLTDIWKGSN